MTKVNSRQTDQQGLLAGYPGRMLLVMSVGTLSIMAGRLVISPLLPSIIDDLAMTTFQAGVALSLMWGLTASLQYFSGRFADELSRKTVLLTGLSIAIIGLVLLSTTDSYALFLLATATIGASAGIYPVAAYVQTSDLFQERRGAAFGVLSASMDLGGAVAPVFAIAVLALLTWRFAFAPIFALVVLVMVLLHFWNRESYVVERLQLNVRETGYRIFGTASTRRVLFAAGLVAFTWQGMASFLPTFLQAEKGFSPTVASAVFTGLFVVGAGARPLTGRLGDRYGYLRISTLTALLGATGLALLLAAESLPLAVVSTAMFGAGIAGFWPTTLTMISQVFPDESLGGDFGASRMAYVGLGSLGPVYIGYVAGEMSYAAAFVGLIGCLLVSASVVFWQLRVGSER